MSSNGHRPSPAEITPPPAPSVNGKEKPAAEIFDDHDQWYGIVDGSVDQAHVNKSDLSVMFIDIDALKAANDELGHDAGDQLIETVNRVITESVRNTNNPNYPGRKLDVVTSHKTELRDLDEVIEGVEVPEPRAARIGGDEFGILLPDTDRDGTNALAFRLREALANELDLPENQSLAEVGVGISIGSATLEPDMSASDFLRIADQAMYINKLEQLRPLSDQEKAEFHAAIEHLGNAGVRPRDVPKYIKLFGASAVRHALDNQAREAAGQLTLGSPESDQTDQSGDS